MNEYRAGVRRECVRVDGDGVPKDIAARFVDVLVQAGAHLVVGQEGHVAGMRDGQYLPVAQQRTPRLEQSEKRARTMTHYARVGSADATVIPPTHLVNTSNSKLEM